MINKQELQKHSEVFDDFVNLAVDKITTDPDIEINFVEVMAAYNYLKNALSTVEFNEE